MATRTGLFLIFLIHAVPLGKELTARFVVWNVGQGLWTTAITETTCLHFDMGGERPPWKQVMDLCRKKTNAVHLSHWDTDHISFVARGRYFLPMLCRLNEPPFARSESKLKMLRRVPPCRFRYGDWTSWQPRSLSTSNGQSVVVTWSHILIPGDSSSAEEKVWSADFNRARSARVLILGHHGSQTSTSEKLLSRLSSLKIAVASARKRRYGHPHRQVIDRLHRFGVPVLSTEDWGAIYIWL